jgi:hypothetical protein
MSRAVTVERAAFVGRRDEALALWLDHVLALVALEPHQRADGLRVLRSERAYLMGLRDEAAARHMDPLVVMYRAEIAEIDEALVKLEREDG